MRQLWQLVVKAHPLLLFLLLEIIALSLLFNRNAYHKAALFNTTSSVVGGLHAKQSQVDQFFELEKTNQELIDENTRLKQRFLDLEVDSLESDRVIFDSLTNSNFTYRNARVVSLTENRSRNFITVDKGSMDGITIDQGVLSSNGLVGRVIAVNDSYARILPVINANARWNVQHAASGSNGNLTWEGINSQVGRVSNIPRHVDVQIGDSIVTNNYSKVIPRSTPVAVVKELNYDASGNFYELAVNFVTEFNKLNFVYLTERMDLDSIADIEAETGE